MQVVPEFALEVLEPGLEVVFGRKQLNFVEVLLGLAFQGKLLVVDLGRG